MKKKIKQIFSALLVAVMLLTAAPLSGFAGLELPNLADLFTLKADAAAYSGKCGDNLTWSLDTDTGVLTISGTGYMYNWSSDTNVPWYSNRSSIKTVVIGDSVTSIEDLAFFDCTSLTSVTIPDSVTSIGVSAFEDCESLTSVTIGNSVTSIGWDAFHGCISLTSVTIGNSVTSIGYCAFYNCTGLTSIAIPDSVTSIGGGAFYNCTGLTSVTIPDSVTSISGSAFRDCTGLTDVYYSGSEKEWQNILIGNRNECLTNATIHYNYVLEPETVDITDERTGIKVSAPSGTFDGDVTLKVEEVLSGSSFDIIGKVNGKSRMKVFTIETYVDGQSVQPNGDVTVRIPVPDGFNAEKCKLYYLNTSSKNPEEIAFRVEDGYIVFTTNRFGDWAIIQTAEMPTVSVNDIGLNYKKSVALKPSVTVDENASYTVTYTSSNPSVARVDENGKVYGAKKGSADITVTVTDSYGNSVSDTCKVNVKYTFGQWLIVIVLFGWIWY